MTGRKILSAHYKNQRVATGYYSSATHFLIDGNAKERIMKLAKSLSSTLEIKNNLFSKILWKKISSYCDVCNYAQINDYIFSNFKRHPQYRKILEHVSCEQGAEYLAEIKRQNRININIDAQILLKNDIYGNPEILDYGKDGVYSPSTLRYAKVTSDIIDIFSGYKSGERISIVEIGVGYGGQCLLLDSFLDIESYTLIDISPALGLAKLYLERFAIRCKLNFFTINEIGLLKPDLLISNYAFSELNRDLQDIYIQKVISNSKNGYITYNHITDSSYETYTADEFITALPFTVCKRNEVPLTYPDNVILTWESCE